MVKIRMVSDENDLFSFLEASGHAGMSSSGSDIVCSAITALLKTAVLSLTSAVEKSNSLEVKTRITRKGQLSIKVKGFDKEDCPRLKYLLEFLTIGLMAIKADYSDYLDLKIESVKD